MVSTAGYSSASPEKITFPSYEGYDMYHSIEKPIDSLPLIFNTIMSFCLLHTKCKPSCLKQIMPVKFLISFSKKQLFLS